MAAATFGAVLHPFWAVLLYYFCAVLRPQFIWQWSLPDGVRWSMLAAAIVAFGVITHLGSIWRKLDLNVVVILIVLYVGWSCASILTAFSPAQSLRWVDVLLKVALMAIVAVYLVDRLHHLRILAAMILLCSGYIAYEENWKYLFLNRLDIYHIGYGGLDNNGAALVLAIALPLAYCFTLGHASGIWKIVRWAALISALMILHVLLLSYSRGAMVAAIIGLAWLALNHRPRRQTLAGVAALLVLVLVLAGPEVRDRFLSIQNYQHDGSAMRRVAAWEGAWSMAWNRPLFGYGLRNSEQFIREFNDDRVAPVVHSQYLQVAADSGIPAMMLVVGLLGVCMYRLYWSRCLCRSAMEETDPIAEPDRYDRLQSSMMLWLGLEASMLTLIAGQMFLSIEVVELPWLLYVIAAVSPRIAMSLVDTGLADQPEDVAPSDRHTPGHAAPAPAADPPLATGTAGPLRF